MSEDFIIAPFCSIDNFCARFEPMFNKLFLPNHRETTRKTRLCLSELMTGPSFIDSTTLTVCHICRASSHKTFKGNLYRMVLRSQVAFSH